MGGLLMAARTGGGCCCKCMWLDQDWPVLPTPHIEMQNVDTESHSVILVSGDGSPIGCRTSADVFDFKIGDKQLPCIEYDYNLTFPLIAPPPYFYLNEYFIGQTFSEFEFLPDGQPHTFTAFIDTAQRYSEAHNIQGVAGEVLNRPITDATVPTAVSFTASNYLYAEQNGNHFVTPCLTNAGSLFIASTGSPVAGDWARWAGATAAADVRTLDSAIWQQVGPVVISGGQSTFLSAVRPDFTNGAPPIYFGWANVLSAQSQVLTPAGLPGGDLRNTRWHQTVRIDRFCMTIT